MLHVVDRPGQCSPRRGHAVHRNREPLLRQVCREVLKRLAFVPEQVRCRHPDIGEEQLGRVLAVHPDLFEIAPAFEARHATLHDQQRHTGVAFRRIGLGGDDHEVGVDPVRNEGLGSVEDVFVAVAHRRGGDPGQVGPRTGFGHGDRGDQRAGSDPRQPSCRLLGRGVLDEVRGGDVVVEGQPEPGPRHPGGCDLLADDLVETEVMATAASVLFRDRHPDESELAGSSEHLAGDDPCSLPVEKMGSDLVGHECCERLAKRLVILIEQTAHTATLRPTMTSRKSANPIV